MKELFYLDDDMKLAVTPCDEESAYTQGMWCAMALAKAVNEAPDDYPGRLVAYSIRAFEEKAGESEAYAALFQGFTAGVVRSMVLCNEFTVSAISESWETIRKNALVG